MKIKYNKDNQPYVLIRGEASGVFVGFLKEKTGREVHLLNCRRIWKWSGAASISQLAISGTSLPENCKFPEETIEHTILDCIEIIPCTEQSYDIIKNVPIWME